MNLNFKIPENREGDFARMVAEFMVAAGAEVKLPERSEPFTVAEAAEAVGLHERTIRREIKAGLWPLVPRTTKKLLPAWAVRCRQEGRDPMKESGKRSTGKRGF